MKILLCPLNWGLGHATRCVPIIRELVADGHEVVIAADGFPLEFLHQQFPNLRLIEVSSYAVRYSSGKTQVLAMLWNLPNIFAGIRKEHSWLKKLLKNEHFDQVISDNRFGLWNKKTHCIYITHQLMVKMPLMLKILEPLIWLIHRVVILRYNECWIPDTEGKENLSGDLSHKYPLPRNAEFIGPLSRFRDFESKNIDDTYEAVAVLSGVEPQRSIFEHELMRRFQHSGQKMLIVCGQPTAKKRSYHVGDVTLVSHLHDEELAPILKGAKKIISRSGYSSIMDLEALNCLGKTELIPIPGQTEQEYLKSIH
ncbi:MAG: hypothetical protein LLF95_01165 [Bacteroidales bacterium]|nr:hypothetical protein [Bacteroidales bacterium]